MRTTALSMVWILTLCSAAGCKSGDDSGKPKFSDKMYETLKAGIAARDVGKVFAGCSTLDAEIKNLPVAQAKEVEQLCFVEAPRLFLENAITSVKNPEPVTPTEPPLPDITCFQMTADQAMEILQKHPTTDAGVLKLVDEYNRLCPMDPSTSRRKPAKT